MGCLAIHNIGYDTTILAADGCQLATPPELFQTLMIATKCDPCTTGCHYFNGGKCPAYQKYHTDAVHARHNPSATKTNQPDTLIGGKYAGMTTKQIRKMEGDISPNEFQKRKLAGKYKE